MDLSMFWTLAGVGLGVLGIGVTIWLSRAGKPKVRVEVANAWLANDIQVGEWCVSIEAINSGGAPVTLSAFGFRFPTGANLIPTTMEPGFTRLPHRLESHSNAIFMMRAQGILAQCGVTPSALKSWVRLQTGKTVMGPPPPIEAG